MFPLLSRANILQTSQVATDSSRIMSDLKRGQAGACYLSFYTRVGDPDVRYHGTAKLVCLGSIYISRMPDAKLSTCQLRGMMLNKQFNNLANEGRSQCGNISKKRSTIGTLSFWTARTFYASMFMHSCFVRQRSRVLPSERMHLYLLNPKNTVKVLVSEVIRSADYTNLFPDGKRK